MNPYKRGKRVKISTITGMLNGTVTSAIPDGKVWVRYTNPVTGEEVTQSFEPKLLSPRTHPIILLVQLFLIILVGLAVYIAGARLLGGVLGG